MAIEAELADGRILEFPDGTDPKVIQSTVKRLLGQGETTIGGQAKELVKGVVPGAIGLLETAGVGASALLPDEYENKTREFIKGAATAGKKPFEAAPGYEESVGRKLGEGIGSTVPFFALGPAGLAGRVGAGALGVGAGAGEARQAAEAKGATGEERRTATQLGAPVGLLDMLAPNIGPMKSLITTALARGGMEGATEAAQKISQNLIAKGVYDPTQDVLAGSGEEGAYGAGIGALSSLLVDLALGRKARGTSTKPTPLESPLSTPEEENTPLAIGMNQPFTPVSLPDGSVAMTQEDLDAYEQAQFEGKYASQPADKLALGLSEPFSPVALPDGSVALTKADLEAYEQEQFEKQYAPQPNLNTVQPATTPPQLGYSPLPGVPKIAADGTVLLNEEQEFQARVAPQKTRITTEAWQAMSPEEQQSALLEAQMATAPESIPEARPAKLTKEQQKPIYSSEEIADVNDAKAALKDVNAQIAKAKTEGTDLFNRLKGALHPDDVTDIAPAEKGGRLKMLASRSGGQMLSNMVADGSLNEFLPPDMRIEAPGQDETAGVEYIKEALRNGDTRSFDSKIALQALEKQKEELKSRAERPAAERAANLELGDVAEGLQDLEALSGDDLLARANELDIDVEGIFQDVARQTDGMTTEQYRGEARKALISAINSSGAGVETLASASVDEAPAAIATKEELQMERDLQGKTLLQAAQYAVDKAPDNFRKFVAQKILGVLKAMEAAGVKFTFDVHSGNQRSSDLHNAKGLATFIYGQQGNPTSVVVLLNGTPAIQNQRGFPSGMNYTTLLHELLHVATRMKVNFLAKNSPEVKKLFDLYNTVIREFNKQARNGTLPPVLEKYHKRINNALENPDEMMTWGITDTDMQKWMSDIRVGEKTLMDKLVELVREVLGISKPFETALDRLVKTTDSILDIDVKTLANGMKSYKYSLGPSRPRTKTAPQQQSLFSKRAQELFGQKAEDRFNTEAPNWVPEKIWKLHELNRRADAEASGYVDLRENSQGRVASPGALKRNQTMTFRRLNKAVEDYVGNDWAAVNDLMVRMNEESSRRDEEFSNNVETFKLGFGKNQSSTTPTGAGAQSMKILNDMGRGNQKAEPGYAEKIRQSWDNARDNPRATMEAAKAATSSFLDRLETWTFSSDAALNNRIREEVQSSTLSSDAKIGMLLNTSLSQTVHSDAVASLFLQRGGIKYNEELHKWEGVENQSNFVKLSKQLDALAEKNGLTKQQAELVAHTAFEAKRLRSLLRFNAELEDKVAAVRAEASAKKASSPVAASALSKEASRLQGQMKFISPAQEAMIGPGMELFKVHPELNDVVKTWNEIRTSTVKTLVDTGLWSENEAEEMLSNADYVPFYREEQLENNQGPKEFIRGLQVKAKEHRFKGSSRPVNDIFDNQVRWVQYSINRAVRNRSALALADTAVEVGAAKQVKDRQSGENVVRVWRNGEEQFYSMDDPMFMEAFTGLEAIVIPSWKWASEMANVLRQSVVMYPLFSVAQVPQDSFAAMFSSGLKPQYALRIPVLAVKEFVQTLRGKSKTHEELKNVGAVGVRDFTSAIVRMDAEIYAGLKAPPGVLGKVKYALNHIAMSADNAVRQAVYEAAIAQGVSRAEAMEKAFEVFNVRRKGSSKSLALAGQLIPFFNAYLAAQNVAYKTITGRGISPTERQDAFKTLAATTASVMVLSLMYAMLNGDDEDYLKKPATVRDRLLMIPGTGMSVPLRADLFTMPKIITEHMYLMMTDKGYEDGRKFRDSMAAALGSAVLGPTAVPQAIKPLVEVGINYDFFQGRPLVGTYQQKLDTERQFTDSTSELGKILGKTGLVSPIAADHLIRGMFGSAGGLIIYATNPILHSDPNSPRPSLSERDAIAALPGMGGFMTKSYESALKKDFYTLKEEVDKAANTLNDLKTRSPQEIEGFLGKEENLARVGLQKSVNAIGERLSNIRKAITQTTNSSMPADQKQQQIEMLRKAEEEMLKGVNVKMLRELGKI